MTEKYRKPLRLACEDAFLPYLRQVLEQNPPERHAEIEAQFSEHMDFLTDFCLRGYPGPGGLTVEFIKGLHRAMFPPGYRQEIVTRDGHKVWMVPGEFKIFNNVGDSYLHPGKVNKFLPAEQVSDVLFELVRDVNHLLIRSQSMQQRTDAIIGFMGDFLFAHPFADANGRVCYIVAETLAIRNGLPPLGLGRIINSDYVEFVAAMELSRQDKSLEPYYRVLARHGFPRETGGRGKLHQGITKSAFDVYWGLRYTAFSLWDKGIEWDWEGLHSVKPEALAQELAQQIHGDIVFDACCGIGGYAIALARTGKKVIAADIDEKRLGMAKKNADIYGVSGSIEFIHGDAKVLLKKLRYDAVIFDPPWGGPNNKKQNFGWSDFPENPVPFIEAALEYCSEIILVAPIGFSKEQAHIGDYHCDIREASLNGKPWHLNIFYKKQKQKGT